MYTKSSMTVATTSYMGSTARIATRMRRHRDWHCGLGLSIEPWTDSIPDQWGAVEFDTN